MALSNTPPRALLSTPEGTSKYPPMALLSTPEGTFKCLGGTFSMSAALNLPRSDRHCPLRRTQNGWRQDNGPFLRGPRAGHRSSAFRSHLPHSAAAAYVD